MKPPVASMPLYSREHLQTGNHVFVVEALRAEIDDKEVELSPWTAGVLECGEGARVLRITCPRDLWNKRVKLPEGAALQRC